ncbi:HipA domain-containing protein [Thalassomonas viridans]|uniref:HipA domain-containing protein n=1 Tax=Thalassomonas viridans TaxID=137584 RepID=A0AAF0C9Z1_9GAMM|nr:HipA domain-containing protein [Thalassomonas viridans]WDE05339.1 HipA domain-containing protein [Thalassomonas viridans]
MTNGINTNNLCVFIGHHRKIATISIPVGSETDISLIYEPSWVNEGFAISPHLPLDGNFDHRAVRNYLQNLLPEGKGLEELTSNTTISKNNTFGLIKVIGEETSGALSFRGENNASNETAFREVTEGELNARLTRFKALGESITYWDGRTRLSVAGVQDKLNLLEMNNQLGFGEGELCSNKIFKFESGKAPFIAVNELFTMLLASEAGIQVPHVEVRTYGGVRTFVINRFDRRVISNKRVLRRHIIDGCQATNLPPSYKYERQHGDEGDGIYIRDGVSFPKLFAIETANPDSYKAQLIRWMTFNILVRNYDAHGKNISFFVGKQGLELTPFYDLVNIEAIIREIQSRQANASGGRGSSTSQYYAMSIGEYTTPSAGNFSNPITAYMLADFADEFGISLPRMQLLMSQMIKSVVSAVDTAKKKAFSQGLSDEEINHINLCIVIINEAVEDLSVEVEQLPTMKEFLNKGA